MNQVCCIFKTRVQYPAVKTPFKYGIVLLIDEKC